MKNFIFGCLATLFLVSLLAVDGGQAPLMINGQEAREINFDFPINAYCYQGKCHINSLTPPKEELERQFVEDGFVRWQPPVAKAPSK